MERNLATSSAELSLSWEQRWAHVALCVWSGSIGVYPGFPQQDERQVYRRWSLCETRWRWTVTTLNASGIATKGNFVHFHAREEKSFCSAISIIPSVFAQRRQRRYDFSPPTPTDIQESSLSRILGYAVINEITPLIWSALFCLSSLIGHFAFVFHYHIFRVQFRSTEIAG